MQPQNLHAAGQRIRQLRHQQHICRPRQDKPPGFPSRIHRRLQRGEQFRHPLHFVQNRPLGQIGDITHRVRLRRRPLDIIIKTEIGEPRLIPDLPGQRRLTALPRAVDQHHRRIGQCLYNPGLEISGI